jgi:hypothetical protein
VIIYLSAPVSRALAAPEPENSAWCCIFPEIKNSFKNLFSPLTI